MTQIEQFINDITNDAFLKAAENPTGWITISQLDQIIYDHPAYEFIHPYHLDEAVSEIEYILKSNNRLFLRRDERV